MFTELKPLLRGKTLVVMTIAMSTEELMRITIQPQHPDDLLGNNDEKKPRLKGMILEATPEELDAPGIDFSPMVEVGQLIETVIKEAAEASRQSIPKPAAAKPPAEAPTGAPAPTGSAPVKGKPGPKPKGKPAAPEAAETPPVVVPPAPPAAPAESEEERATREADEKKKADKEAAKEKAAAEAAERTRVRKAEIARLTKELDEEKQQNPNLI